MHTYVVDIRGVVLFEKSGDWVVGDEVIASSFGGVVFSVSETSVVFVLIGNRVVSVAVVNRAVSAVVGNVVSGA